jgi:ankyrin repeat protein
MSSDVEAARADLVNHLASCSTWDNESDKLTEQFAMAMLEAGFSETSAIQELFSAGISKRAAKQVVLSVGKNLGIAPKPSLFVRILSRIIRGIIESRVSKRVYTCAVRYRYIILVLIIAGIGLICYDAIRYKMTEEEREFLHEIQDKLDANAYLNIAWLNEAASKKYLAVTKYLVKKGADVNGTDNSGFAPLHYVESAKITKILLKKGAHPNIKSNDGRTPLHMYINDPSIIRMLIRGGADVNARDNKGRTPLDTCGYMGLQKAEVLMQKDGRVGSEQGAEIINAFAEKDHYYKNLVKLLNAGANPNVSGRPYGLKPIHAAVVGNSIRNVKLLLSRGADINATGPPNVFAGKWLDVLSAQSEQFNIQFQNNILTKKEFTRKHDVFFIEGMTPLEIAEKLEFHEIAKLLRDRGAR